MRSVSYRGGDAALRTGCVDDAHGQGTTQARARRCARWRAVAAGSAWRTRDRAGDRLLARVQRREAELAVGISGDFFQEDAESDKGKSATGFGRVQQ
jgi:hypothetical protein